MYYYTVFARIYRGAKFYALFTLNRTLNKESNLRSSVKYTKSSRLIGVRCRDLSTNIAERYLKNYLYLSSRVSPALFFIGTCYNGLTSLLGLDFPEVELEFFAFQDVTVGAAALAGAGRN